MTERILIVKLSSLGDVLHTLPAAQALRAARPRAWIGWAVERGHAPLLRGQPWLDELIEWDRGTARGLARFLSHLRRTTWHTAIDFQGLFRSGLATWWSGAPRRIGSAGARELAPLFYTERVPSGSLDRHAVDRSLDLVARLGARVPGLPLDRPYVDGRPPAVGLPPQALFPLYPNATEARDVHAWLAQRGFDPQRQQLVILNPHCRRPANVWPLPRFAELARRLLEVPTIRVAISGGAVARELGDRLSAIVGDRLWRADGRFSLLGSAVLFARASAVVTGDTGPMHIAAAVGTPIVAMLGATAPVRTGPYAADAVVLHKRLDCSPCLAKHCRLALDSPPCQEQITVDDVFAAVLAQLARHAHAEPLRTTA